MFKKQIYIVSDKNKSSFKIKNFLTRNLQSTNINKADIIIVLGGDGFMLQALKKFYKFNKPFYGINTGDYGFLMNKFSKENLVKNLSNADLVKISPIQMIVKNASDMYCLFLLDTLPVAVKKVDFLVSFTTSTSSVNIFDSIFASE